MAIKTGPVYLEARNVFFEFPLKKRVTLPSVAVGGQIIGPRRLLAVDNLSFSLAEGESLGLLGHNGCGKTTLLRLLAGIYLPDSGNIKSQGIIRNALDTQLGYRLELTGRENIRQKALLNKYKRQKIDELILDVENFAELGPFLDQPLGIYSAGMRARLVFGIATAFYCDILILDEWLGAGDQYIKEKVVQRLNRFVEQAAIVVCASHSTHLLSRICTQGLVMQHGKCSYLGNIEQAIEVYENMYVK